MKISIRKGLDIPIRGKPLGPIVPAPFSQKAALSLQAFADLRFKILVKEGERVKIGTPLVENKAIFGQLFAAPAAGVISEIRRGVKRSLIDIVISIAEKEDFEEFGSLNDVSATQGEIIAHLMRGGIFPHIRMRPFDLIANPAHLPRDIFVHCFETSPLAVSAEAQVSGHEEAFQIGLNTLKKLSLGRVYLGFDAKSSCKAFLDASGVEKYAISGPHPAGNVSTLIHFTKPILHAQDWVWTLSCVDVVAVGMMMQKGRYHHKRVFSISGDGILEGKRCFIDARAGMSVEGLVSERLTKKGVRLISGDPLTGFSVGMQDYLGFYHTALCAFPENVQREPFHFLGLGAKKYSATRAYLGRHSEGHSFTTNQHGEERPFVDSSIYDKVMPLQIPTVHLIKAVLSQNYELAIELGLLEVTGGDFALSSFICPSKIEMVEIINKGLQTYAKEMGH